MQIESLGFNPNNLFTGTDNSTTNSQLIGSNQNLNSYRPDPKELAAKLLGNNQSLNKEQFVQALKNNAPRPPQNIQLSEEQKSQMEAQMKQKAEELFAQLDNGDGKLTKEELENGFSKISAPGGGQGQFPPSPEQITSNIFGDQDSISKSELLKKVQGTPLANILENALQNSGDSISKESLQELLKNLAPKVANGGQIQASLG